MDNLASRQQYTDEQLEQTAETIKRLANAIMEVFKKVIETIKRWAKSLWDKLMEAAAKDADPKWWHYYKHSKKMRVRKKYQTRIRNHITKLLVEGGQP